MPDEVPSNAVLAQMLRSLEDRIRLHDEEETRWQSRMDGQMDTFSRIVVQLQTSGAVVDTRLTGRADANATAIAAVRGDLKTRMDDHDKFHETKDKEARFRTSVTIAVLTALGTLASAAVAIALALH